MSAIGVTDWFENKKASPLDVDGSEAQVSDHTRSLHDLPASDYPEAFLVDAASKIGVLFFASNFADVNVLILLHWHVHSKPTAREYGVGSLFPFATQSGVRTHRLSEVRDCEHPSVKTWQIGKRSVHKRRQALYLSPGRAALEVKEGTTIVISKHLTHGILRAHFLSKCNHL